MEFETYLAEMRKDPEYLEAEKELIEDAIALERAGAFSIVLEKIVSGCAKKITEKVKIPTIGIGAGKYCDGQILVYADMLGLNKEFHPKFVHIYADIYNNILDAFKNYIKDVKEQKFPSEKESY